MGSLFGGGHSSTPAAPLNPMQQTEPIGNPWGPAASMALQSYGNQAGALQGQALIAQKEGTNEALQQADSVQHFREDQAASVGNSGVLLQGSPLLQLEYTRQKGQQEVDAILARSQAQSNLLTQQATQVMNEGRASLLGTADNFVANNASNNIQFAQGQAQTTAHQLQAQAQAASDNHNAVADGILNSAVQGAQYVFNSSGGFTGISKKLFGP